MFGVRKAYNDNAKTAKYKAKQYMPCLTSGSNLRR